jgi:hypothetical protein
MWKIRCILLWSNEYTYYESITRDYHVYLGGGSLCLAPCNVWSFFLASQCLHLTTSYFNLPKGSVVGKTLEMEDACATYIWM